MRRALAVSAVFVGLLTAACGEIASGDLATETRTVDQFDSLDVSSGVNVELVVDPDATPSVTVTYDDNLLDNLITRVSGGTLRVYFEGSVTSLGGDNRVVTVTMNTIDRIEASGGADLVGTGTVAGYQLDASGGADVDLSGLDATEVEIDASGGADVTVFASESVEGDASGGANVHVEGNPARVLVDTSGGADVEVED